MSEATPQTAPRTALAPATLPDDVPADLAALLSPLDGLEDRPVDEHPAAYEQVHGRLRAVLAGQPVAGDAPQA